MATAVLNCARCARQNGKSNRSLQRQSLRAIAHAAAKAAKKKRPFKLKGLFFYKPCSDFDFRAVAARKSKSEQALTTEPDHRAI